MALNRPYLRLPTPERMNFWQYRIFYWHPGRPGCRGHATTRWSGLPLQPDEIIRPGEQQISEHQYYELRYGTHYKAPEVSIIL